MEAGTSTADPPPTSKGDDGHDHTKRLRSASSSSSSDASFIDLQVDDNVRHVRSMPVAGQSTDALSAKEPSSASRSLTQGLNTSSKNDLKSPGAKVMDRNDDETTPYRIPSSVFARTISNSPNEWSLNSNESLFSIYMGNTSFNRDLACNSSMYDSTNPPPPPVEHQISQLGSSPLLDYLPRLPAESSNRVTNLDDGTPEVVETQAVWRLSADHKPSVSVSDGAAVGSPSRISNSSAMSFAFPILTDRQKSVQGVMKKVNEGSAVTDLQPSEQPQSEEEVPAEENPKQQVAPKAARAMTKSKWLSCFSCCSSRS